MTHHLKSYPEFFAATIIGVKTHEVRNKSDNLSVDGENHEFKVGDAIVFHEYDPDTDQYTGEACKVRVTWMSGPKPWLDPDYVVISITREAMA